MGWFFWTGMAVLYLVLLFTVCALTFRKGHTVLGILGIFLPILWLIGAMLPPTENSNYAATSGRY